MTPIRALALGLLLTSCATPAPPPPSTVPLEVSRPCAALGKVEPLAAVPLTPQAELVALYRQCDRGDGDEEACGTFVRRVVENYAGLMAWAGPASAAILACAK